MQAGSQAGENGSSGVLLNCCGVEVRGAENCCAAEVAFVVLFWRSAWLGQEAEESEASAG